MTGLRPAPDFRTPPRAHSPPKELQIDFTDSQVVYSGDYCDSAYSFDESKLLQKKKKYILLSLGD